MKTAAHLPNPGLREQVARDYRLALDQFLTGAGEAALQQAYEIGRRAVTGGIGVLEMALLHCTAVEEKLPAASSPEQAAWLRKAATEFFLESLAPHEMAYRGFREANRSLRQLNELLEEQARKIAHAIHDEAGQLLIAVHLALSDLAQEAAGPARSRVEEITSLLGQVEQELRGLSHELRPTMLDDLGLVPALEFLAQRFTKRGPFQVTLEAKVNARLPASLEVVLYRVVQESLANAARHSRARSVRILLEQNHNRVCGSIRDDGVGFDVTHVLSQEGQRGLGLVGMGERLRSVGGTLQVKSVPGRGTELLITVPTEESHASTSVSSR
jgi:signal transduction histidine kinase